MKARALGICAAMAFFAAGKAAIAENGAESQSNAAVLRRLMVESGVTFTEKSEENQTKFVFYISPDDNSVEIYQCIAFVEEGDFYAYCMAVLPLTIPSNRLDAVAETLEAWNGERECGYFGLDFNRRGAFFVSTIPVDSLREKDALMSLTLLGMPVYCIAEKDAAIRAVAGGAAPPAADYNDSDGDNSMWETVHDAHVVSMEIGDADAGGATPTAEEDASAASKDGIDNFEIDIPLEDKIHKWLVTDGVDPIVVTREPNDTTFQFPVRLGHGAGLFTDATAQITIRGCWVSVFVSPNVRVSSRARPAMSKALLKATNVINGIAFLWLLEGRFAARIVAPVTLVDKNPAHAMAKMLNLAGQALTRHSSEFLDEAMAFVQATVENRHTWGRLLSDSSEPLESEYWNTRLDCVIKHLGVPEAGSKATASREANRILRQSACKDEDYYYRREGRVWTQPEPNQ